jgi:spore coat polysaccharide biosynthesis protein SpsF
MGSVRLPGKSLMDLAGAPLVGRILERVKRCRRVDEIVLATPDTPSDDQLAALGPAYGVGLFRGSENDLVDRYYQAARAFRADIVLRLPADNPTSEPSEIDRCVDAHAANDADFTSNITHFFGNNYPDGIGIEAFDVDALANVWRTEQDPLRREHVGANFVDYAADRAVQPDRYKVATIQCPWQFARPDLKLDVNLADEFAYFRDMYEALYPANPEFGILDIIHWHDARQTQRARAHS